MEHEAKRRKLANTAGIGGAVDYYNLLEIPPNADLETVKHAYHKLALRYHPDRNKGNEVECETRFKELASAYAVLSDPEKRSQYDATHRFFQSNELREAFNQFVSSGSTSSFNDFFGSFSSRSFSSFSSLANNSSFSFNKKKPPAKGQNLRTTLLVTFNESVFGCTKTIALKTLVSCDICEGLGYPKDIEQALCSLCSGTGTYSQRSSLLTINTTCSGCNGKGVVVDNLKKCKYCINGKVHKTKELRIEVPPGVMKNMRKIYEGEGDSGEIGAEAGDLIVVFDVEESPTFKREGDDVICEVSISFFQATLGDHIDIPSLYGHPIRLTIPPGTQPNEVLKIEDEGFMSVTAKKRGRMYVRVLLAIPKTLTLRQSELLFYTQQHWDK